MSLNSRPHRRSSHDLGRTPGMARSQGGVSDCACQYPGICRLADLGLLAFLIGCGTPKASSRDPADGSGAYATGHYRNLPLAPERGPF